jgi:DNA-binding phage protein
VNRIYEQERLQLAAQEAIAEAINRSGMTRTGVARKLGKNRSRVTQALDSWHGLTLRSVADLLWAAGYRLDLKLTRVA